MAKVRVKLNRQAVRDLLKSEEIATVLNEVAEDVVTPIRAIGYEKGKIYKGKNRLNVSITATTYQARKDNLQNNTLIKAIKGGKSK